MPCVASRAGTLPWRVRLDARLVHFEIVDGRPFSRVSRAALDTDAAERGAGSFLVAGSGGRGDGPRDRLGRASVHGGGRAGKQCVRGSLSAFAVSP